MDSLMFLHVGLITEASTTRMTFEGCFVSVLQMMSLQVADLGEGLSTPMAQKRLLPSVSSQVLL